MPALNHLAGSLAVFTAAAAWPCVLDGEGTSPTFRYCAAQITSRVIDGRPVPVFRSSTPPEGWDLSRGFFPSRFYARWNAPVGEYLELVAVDEANAWLNRGLAVGLLVAAVLFYVWAIQPPWPGPQTSASGTGHP